MHLRKREFQKFIYLDKRTLLNSLLYSDGTVILGDKEKDLPQVIYLLRQIGDESDREISYEKRSWLFIRAMKFQCECYEISCRLWLSDEENERTHQNKNSDRA